MNGWNCPNCGKAHGPHVDTCPVQKYEFIPGITPPPIWEAPPIAAPVPWAPPPYTTCEAHSISFNPPEGMDIQVWNCEVVQ